MNQMSLGARQQVSFTRRQLIERSYDSLADPDGLDRRELELRYERGRRRVNIDHAAAVRGILVDDGHQKWRWIWDWGLLHDEMAVKWGYERLHARYRNQFGFLPAIEFESHVYAEPLAMLLEQTPIRDDDNLQITGRSNFRAFCIRDALEQLGYSQITPKTNI
jgi:hypothetical protein